MKETVPGTRYLNKYPVIVKLWLLIENLQTLVYHMIIMTCKNLKAFSMYPQVNGVFTTSARTLFATDVSHDKNNNRSKCRAVEPSPNGVPHTLWHLRVRKHFRRED